MHCPKCNIDLNDDAPQCPACGFGLPELDAALGAPPPRAAPVADLAGVLDETACGRLGERLAAFGQRTGAEFLVATAASTAPRKPSEYVFWLLNRWQVGGADHRGLLLLLALQERRVEVEVGFSLEHHLTDAEAAAVLEHHAVPFLKRGDLAGGLYHAVDVLARVFEHGMAEEPKP